MPTWAVVLVDRRALAAAESTKETWVFPGSACVKECSSLWFVGFPQAEI